METTDSNDLKEIVATDVWSTASKKNLRKDLLNINSHKLVGAPDMIIFFTDFYKLCRENNIKMEFCQYGIY